MVLGTCHPTIAAGMAALQVFYNSATGLWETTKWWNSANALETTIDHIQLTNTSEYRNNLANTFAKQQKTQFLNQWFRDDDGWWALAWIKAYDLTGEQRYLDAAKNIFNQMQQGWDSKCGGGVWWQKHQRTYKNAITNSLLLSIAAKLHLRTVNDYGAKSYLESAKRSWMWIKKSGMINRDHLINDGLTQDCRNNGQTTWTYNQGVLMGGLVDLYKSTNDPKLLAQAHAIAAASIQRLAPNGILREACEPNCGDDGVQFKGVFMRNLSALHQVSQREVYREFIMRNARSILAQSHKNHRFGLSWSDRFDQANAARQSSAMDALNAAIAVGQQPMTYQAEWANGTRLAIAKFEKGYRGSGYVSDWDRDGQWITFNVDVACGGYHDLALRYTSVQGSSRQIYLNDRPLMQNHRFAATGRWDRWQQSRLSKVWLNPGKNTIAIIYNRSQGSRNELKLDELALLPEITLAAVMKKTTQTTVRESTSVRR